MSYSLLDVGSFQKGLQHKPDFVGVDSGGLDLGPLYLGAEREHGPWEWYERNLEVVIEATRRQRIPLVIGNAGGNGTGGQVDRTLESVRLISAKKSLHLKVVTIHADVSPDFLRMKTREGKVFPLGLDGPLDEETISKTAKTTAMMGPEPIMESLKMGADVVLAGRCCDDAIFAAPLIMGGIDRGIAHHVGKVLECASLCATPTSLEHTIVATASTNHFEVEPASPEFECKTASVAAHAMYERDNPFIQRGPGGLLDLSKTQYEQITPRRVRVSGSRFREDKTYRVKVEGAALVGYRAVDLKGIRDPNTIAQMDEILGRIRGLMAERLLPLVGDVKYEVYFHVYGRDAVMGPLEPLRDAVPHEVALVIEVLAPSRDLALQISSFLGHQLSHLPYKGRKATAGNLAYLVDPHPFDAGPAYRFTIDHLVALDSPVECFRTTLTNF